MKKHELEAFAFETINIVSGINQLSVPIDAKYAEIKVESSITSTSPLRYLIQGNISLPTSTIGLVLNNLDFFDILGYKNLVNFRVIETTSGTHTLTIQYYK